MSVEELPTDKMKLCDLINNLIIKVNTHDEKFNTLNTKIDGNFNTLNTKIDGNFNTLNKLDTKINMLMAKILEPEEKSRKKRCINWLKGNIVSIIAVCSSVGMPLYLNKKDT